MIYHSKILAELILSNHHKEIINPLYFKQIFELLNVKKENNNNQRDYINKSFDFWNTHTIIYVNILWFIINYVIYVIFKEGNKK